MDATDSSETFLPNFTVSSQTIIIILGSYQEWIYLWEWEEETEYKLR
jgi:hypothetical protein